LRAGFSDAQCGFKAIRADVAARLLPLVEDTGWFFDTELLVLAERAGLRIHEVPVDWVDDPDSRVELLPTALADLKGMVRIGRGLATGAIDLGPVRALLGRAGLGRAALDDDRGRSGLAGQALRFAVIGAVSTVAYLLLFLALRSVWPAQLANVAALGVTAVANTAANRRLTFGVRGSSRAMRSQLQGLVVFAIGWAVTAFALAGLAVGVARPARWLELGVLVCANLLATAVRFLLFRQWVFRESVFRDRVARPSVARPSVARPSVAVARPDRSDRSASPTLQETS
jgi:putative flippase GtrA